jgi:glycosyltransferase involved in cell wall biosynthesis
LDQDIEHGHASRATPQNSNGIAGHLYIGAILDDNHPMADARPLRILHLTAGSDAGGVSRYMHSLCQAMHEAGHEVAIAGERGVWHDLFAGAPWPWIEAPLKAGPMGLRRAERTIAKYVAEHPVDVIHTHYRKATLIARRVQKTAHSPLLYSLHLSPIPISGPRGWFTDFGDHIHTPSVDGRQWLIDDASVAPGKITVIPHGIDATKFPVPDASQRQAARTALNLAPEDRVALFVGRLENPKNEAWLLDIAEAIPNLHVLLVGDGTDEVRLAHHIESKHLTDHVRLLGRRDPLLPYHAADALLLPSAAEGFSYACAEAMCAGLPVLRTHTSGTSELILENITGRSTPIDRPAFVSAAIEFLSDAPALRRMGIAAADHIRKNFTFDHQLAQTISLYHRLLGSSAPGTSSGSSSPAGPLKS